MVRIALLIVTLMSLAACDREDPNPHEKDPIYLDLVVKSKQHKGVIDESKKSLAELLASLERAEPNSMEVKDLRRKIASEKRKILNSEQWEKYFRIRAERRKVVDQISAHEAYVQKKQWPDPDEYSDYQVNNRLHEVSMNWNKRVPKLKDRLPKPKAKETKGEEVAADSAEQ